MKWKCLRCETIFDGEKIKEAGCPCKCTESPSPWEPIHDKLEVDYRTMVMIMDLLKDMYDLSQSDHLDAIDAQNVIMDGADIYADYFRNNN